jgi:hypothetical protein
MVDLPDSPEPGKSEREQGQSRDIVPRSSILHSFLNFLESSSICLSIASEMALDALSSLDMQLPIVTRGSWIT